MTKVKGKRKIVGENAGAPPTTARKPNERIRKPTELDETDLLEVREDSEELASIRKDCKVTATAGFWFGSQAFFEIHLSVILVYVFTFSLWCKLCEKQSWFPCRVLFYTSTPIALYRLPTQTKSNLETNLPYKDAPKRSKVAYKFLLLPF